MNEPFYWLLFRVSDAEDAPWYAGRMLTVNRERWLMVRADDVSRLPQIRPQTKLDETLLLERFDVALGGTYFVHQGPLREKQ